jgi:hypothetical protein
VPDVADGAPREIGRAAKDHVNILACGLEKLSASGVVPPRRIVLPGALQVRGEQRIERNLPRSFGSRISSRVCISKTDECGSPIISLTMR